MGAQPIPPAEYNQQSFPTVPSDLLTLEEAAVAARVTAQTIRNWIRLGTIPAYRLANHRDLRVSLSTLAYKLPNRLPTKRHMVDRDGEIVFRHDPRPAYEHRIKRPSRPASESKSQSDTQVPGSE